LLFFGSPVFDLLGSDPQSVSQFVGGIIIQGEISLDGDVVEQLAHVPLEIDDIGAFEILVVHPVDALADLRLARGDDSGGGGFGGDGRSAAESAGSNTGALRRFRTTGAHGIL
jgi:hypothetical protein